MAASPKTAAASKSRARGWEERKPWAAKAPAAKRRESPGRKGVTTKPVSAKMVRKISR